MASYRTESGTTAGASLQSTRSALQREGPEPQMGVYNSDDVLHSYVDRDAVYFLIGRQSFQSKRRWTSHLSHKISEYNGVTDLSLVLVRRDHDHLILETFITPLRLPWRTTART